MTWGSNATHRVISCRYCGGDMIDDTDDGESSHEQRCSRRPLWRGLLDLLHVLWSGEVIDSRAIPPPRGGYWVNAAGKRVDGCSPSAKAFVSGHVSDQFDPGHDGGSEPKLRDDTTPTCSLCGLVDHDRPFIRHAISCSRRDCRE